MQILLVLSYCLRILELLIFARILMSFVVSPDSRNPLVEMVHSVTDPILRPIQAVLPTVGPFDLSPMVALLLLRLVGSQLAAAAYG
ncbi:MAG TPA: YggT family protein [Longimicrobium sp.]|nr:YggT family protein [Longimicrobium sp.]